MNTSIRNLGWKPVSRRTVLTHAATGLTAWLYGCSSTSQLSSVRLTVAPLRVEGQPGPCRADIQAVDSPGAWQYRIPETLSCREGVFKVHYHPMVNWTRGRDGSISHEWATSDEDYNALTTHRLAKVYGPVFIQGIRYEVTITPSRHGLDLSFQATNISDRMFHDVTVFPCLGMPSEPFQDTGLQRTFVVTDRGLRPVGEFERGSADPRRTHFRVAGNPEMPFVNKPFWGEPNPTVVEQGAILRLRADGQYTLGTAWQRVAHSL